MGTGPTPLRRNDVKPGSIVPPGVSRNVSEIPSRMLSVASVAMIEGILTPRTRPALTRPSATPHSSMAPAPARIPGSDDPGTIRNDAITTPRLTIAPTDRSR